MRPIFLHVTHLYLVLAVLAGVPAGAGRTVLCVAPNGHVAIEAGEGRCADYVPTAGGDVENSGLNTTPDGCADCVDLPMGKQTISLARHRVPGPSASFNPLTSSVISIANTDRAAASTQLVLAQVDASRPSFSSSRTIILRN